MSTPQFQSSEEQPWHADRQMRQTVRHALEQEADDARALKPRTPKGLQVQMVRLSSAQRLITVLHCAHEQPDLAGGDRSVQLLLHAVGQVRSRTATALSSPAHREAAARYLVDQAWLPLQRNTDRGAPLLRRMLQQRAEHASLRPGILDQLFIEHQRIAATGIKEDAPFAYLLFLLTGSIQQAREILVLRETDNGRSRGVFLQSLRQMLLSVSSVFAGMQEESSGRTVDPGHAAFATEAMGTFFNALLHSSVLRSHDAPQALLANAGTAWLARSDIINPFLRRPLLHAPFDQAKIGPVVLGALPPSTAANVLERMDAAEEIGFIAEKVRSLLAAADQGSDPHVPLRHLCEELRSWLSRPLTSACRAVLVPLVPLIPEQGVLSQAGIAQLRAWLQTNHQHAAEDVLSCLPASDPSMEGLLLLVSLHSKRIVENPGAQRLFLQTYAQALRSPASSPAAADALRRALRESDPFLLLPLQGTDGCPDCRGKTLRDLLEEYAAAAFPQSWASIVPALTLEDIDMERTAGLLHDFSGAIEPVYEARADLNRHARTLKKHWGDEKFQRSWGLLEQEIGRYLGCDAQAHRVMPHLSATQLFNYLLDGLFPALGPGDNAVLTSREYDDMRRRKVGEGEGRAAVRIVPFCDEVTGAPLEREAFLQAFLSQIDSSTRFAVLSVVSRYGDRLFGQSADPSAELAEFLRTLRRTHPELVVILDACQAIGRVPLPPVRDLDDHTILLCTGGKELGVSQFGFGTVPARLEEQIQHKHGYETHLPPDTLRTTSMLSLFFRLRELQSPYRQFDRLASSAGPYPPRTSPEPLAGRERLSGHFSTLTAHALDRFAAYAQGIVSHARDIPVFQDLRPREIQDFLACRVFAPAGHHEDASAGIVTFSFRTLPAPVLAAALAKVGFQTSGSRMDDTCVRIAFHEFQSSSDIDELVTAIGLIHLQHLRAHKGPLIPDERTPQLVERARQSRY